MRRPLILVRSVRSVEEYRKREGHCGPDDLVFCQDDGRPMNPDSIRELGIYPALERAGVPFHKRASGCHAFRHLAGSIVHRETRSLKLAQTLLGQSNISTTGDICTHVDESEMQTVADVPGKVLGDSCGKKCGRNAGGSDGRSLVQKKSSA